MGYNAADYNFNNYRDYLIPGTNTLSPAGFAERDRLTAAREAATAKEQAKGRRLVNLGKLATIAIPTAGMALSAAGAGAGASGLSSIWAPPAASAGSAAGYSSPGIYEGVFGATAAPGAGATSAALPGVAKSGLWGGVQKFFGGKGGDLAVNSALSLYGMNRQKSASDQARADVLNAQREQLELEKAKLAEATRNADLDREDARKLNEAMNALKQRELDLTDEENKFNRDITSRNTAINESTAAMASRREANRAPFLQLSKDAAAKLASIWGLG